MASFGQWDFVNVIQAKILKVFADWGLISLQYFETFLRSVGLNPSGLPVPKFMS